MELEIVADKASFLESQNNLLDARFKETVERYVYCLHFETLQNIGKYIFFNFVHFTALIMCRSTALKKNQLILKF